MALYVTTDWHLRHRRISELEGRPSNFEELILAECKKLKPGDILLNLGDLYLGKSSEFDEYIKDFLVEGVTYLLLRGNHDSLTQAKYSKAGFIMLDSVVLKGVYFSHHGVLTLPSDAQAQVFGHYHSNTPPKELLDAYGYRLSIELEEYKFIELTDLIPRLRLRDKIKLSDEDRHV